MGKEKTNLERLLWEQEIPLVRLREVMGASSQKTVYNKMHKLNSFTLPEMVAIQKQLFPSYSLEYIFEGYGELEQKGA